MSKKSLLELDHQFEKLEFALAISLGIGDKVRSDQVENIGFK
tara:strand:+ start:966 stop:1091 length:126 start_codon:yes stop_codon:yes gene_type:complete